MAFTCFQLSNVRRIGGTQHRTASPLRRRSSAATHAHHHPIPPCALRPITLLRCVSKPMSSLTLRWVAQWRWLQQGRLALGAGSAGRSIFVWNAPPPATPHPATRTALTKQLTCVFTGCAHSAEAEHPSQVRSLLQRAACGGAHFSRVGCDIHASAHVWRPMGCVAVVLK